MEHPPLNIFFLGKGGVGKSTISALTGLSLAQRGFKVLLVSMDPAHNQSDIFGMSLSEKPLVLEKLLYLKEVDIGWWVRKYVKSVQHEIKASYNYLTALNLESYFDVLKFSPGIEEYALLLAFSEIRTKYAKHDYILFDMPPTALALKFFGLPKLSLAWLEKLHELRQLILKKREILHRIQLGSKEWEQDKIVNRLQKQMEFYKKIKSVISDGVQTHIKLILNNDTLSVNESRLILEQLGEQKIKISGIIINKFQDSSLLVNESYFPNAKVYKAPVSHVPLTGVPSLKKYLMEHPELFNPVSGICLDPSIII